MPSVLVQTLLILAVLIAEEIHVNCADADEPSLRPISVEGNWGYINTSGEVVVQPQYVRAHEFSDGFAEVEFIRTEKEFIRFNRTYSGYIDSSGCLVFPAQSQAAIIAMRDAEKYVYYGEFSEGLAKVYHMENVENEGVGFVDKTGKIVIQPRFSTCSLFGEGLAYAETLEPPDRQGTSRQGFINRQGEFVFNIDTSSSGASVKPFRFGRTVVPLGALQILIDSTGNRILGPYKRISMIDRVACIVQDEHRYALFDRDGDVLVPFGRYDRILVSECGPILTATRNRSWYILSTSGDELAEAQPGYELSFAREGLVKFGFNGKQGFLNDRGEVVVEPVYREVADFRSGLARVFIGPRQGLTPISHAGYIDPAGKIVWRTDQWDEPLRYSIREPLSSFLPESTIEALPFSHNWDVRNAIVFTANHSVESLRQWYLTRQKEEWKVSDLTDYETIPGRIELSFWGECQVEVFAVEGDSEEANADDFVDWYVCENMNLLRKKYPNNTIGIILENY